MVGIAIQLDTKYEHMVHGTPMFPKVSPHRDGHFASVFLQTLLYHDVAIAFSDDVPKVQKRRRSKTAYNNYSKATTLNAKDLDMPRLLCTAKYMYSYSYLLPTFIYKHTQRIIPD